VRPRPADLGSRRKARGVFRRAVLAFMAPPFPCTARMLCRHAAGGADWPWVRSRGPRPPEPTGWPAMHVPANAGIV
jgi:hypothetical protein